MEVALLHRTIIPQKMHAAFVSDWIRITTTYGSSDATLHKLPSGQFIQLVIWPTEEAWRAFFENVVLTNPVVQQYFPYTKVPMRITPELLHSYREKLSAPIAQIRKAV